MDSTSIKILAQSFGFWGALTFFVITLIYQIIKDFMKQKEDKAKGIASSKFQTEVYHQLIENSKINQEILKYLKVATDKYNDEITEAQAKIIIDKVFDSTRLTIESYMYQIIDENNLDANKKEIKSKIRSFITNCHNADYLSLKEYKLSNVKLSEYMGNEWHNKTIVAMEDVIFTRKGKKFVNSTLSNYFEEYKNDFFNKMIN